MKAEIKPNYDTKRAVLADIVPLDTPFSFYIEPTRFCNLKCFYCMHSTRDDVNGEFKKLKYDIKHMSVEQFEKIADDIQGFNQVIKRISFSGIGEPLMNRNIPKMVKILRDSGKVDRIDILTNSLLMDNQFAQELIDAGVSKIIVSIQGLNAEDYKENCSANINYDTLLSQLKYFYDNKKENQEIYIKIIDVMLKDKEDEQKFYDTFGNMCDSIYIEHLISLEQPMGNLDGKADDSKNLFNEKVVVKNVCTIPFYYVSINVDGDVFHCSPPGLPREFSYGNVYKDNLVDIWNSKNKRDFLKLQLSQGKPNISWCKKCTCDVVYNHGEMLDDRATEVLERLNKLD